MNNISTYLHAFVYVELNLFCGNFLDSKKDSNEKLTVISVMILKIKNRLLTLNNFCVFFFSFMKMTSQEYVKNEFMNQFETSKNS